jgi:predicted GIY-YIG superfamily endonuclease
MRDFELAYYEVCFSKKDALIREKQLKTGFGRSYLIRRLKIIFRATSSVG